MFDSLIARKQSTTRPVEQRKILTAKITVEPAHFYSRLDENQQKIICVEILNDPKKDVFYYKSYSPYNVNSLQEALLSHGYEPAAEIRSLFSLARELGPNAPLEDTLQVMTYSKHDMQ